jgi:hypothetical protein
MTKVIIKPQYPSSDAIWLEVETGMTYHDDYARRAIADFGDEFYGTHLISDDLAYCLFAERN